jgi:hypothetical protein
MGPATKGQSLCYLSSGSKNVNFCYKSLIFCYNKYIKLKLKLTRDRCKFGNAQQLRPLNGSNNGNFLTKASYELAGLFLLGNFTFLYAAQKLTGSNILRK